MFNDVKIASKGLKVTINDMITACVTSGISQYFEKGGAKEGPRWPNYKAVAFESL
jgi:hypothetical protein